MDRPPSPRKGLGIKIKSLVMRGKSASVPAHPVSAVHFDKWDASLKKLDLRSRQLEYVPPGIFELTNLTWLGFNGNMVTVLPEELSVLQNLRIMRALSNRITHFGPHLGSLSALQVLDLGKNRLNELDPDGLRGLTNLKELLLQWNQITEVPAELGHLTALRKLQLSINRLTELPACLASMSQLEELDLSHNRLTELLPDLQLVSLESLNCAGNELTTLPPSIGALTSLVELDVQMNVLRELPPELGALHRLRRLRLKKNMIREFPREVGGLTSLEELLISDNQFINLPRTIGQLKQLKWLRASENAFIYLPPELGDMPSLVELDLSCNQIETVPKEIGRLCSLRTCVLAENSIYALPEQMCSLSALIDLNLFSNRLVDVPHQLGQLHLLQRLNLSCNAIEALPTELGALTQLEELHVACNRLKTLPDEVVSLPALTLLNVARNELEQAPWLSRASTRLVTLYVSYNSRLNGAELPLHDLQGLTDLNVSGLHLETVPDYVSCLTALKILGLNNNLLSSLGAPLAACANLEVLQAAGNSLTRIEEEPLASLRRLRELDLSHNGIMRIADGVLSKMALQDLDVSSNLLAALPSDCGGYSMPSLTQLKCACNALTALPKFPVSQVVWISHAGNPVSHSTASKRHTLRGTRGVAAASSGQKSPRPMAGSLGVAGSADADGTGTVMEEELGDGPLVCPALEARAAKLYKRRPKPSGNTRAASGLTSSSGSVGVSATQRDSSDSSTPLSSSPSSFSPMNSHSDLRLGADQGLQVGWAEMTGKRPDQQDTITVIRNYRGDPRCAFFAVFDGHGGQTSSEYAASYLHVLLDEALQRSSLVNEAMQTAFRSMHEEIALKGFDDGCAALVVYLTEDRIWLANAGDSRAIMCRKGRAVQISRDHKSDSLDEKRRIQAMHGFITPDRRVNGVLALSRALGDVEQQPHVTYRPDVLEMDVSDAIEYLILACDGLWDVVSNEQVVEIVKSSPSPQAASIQLRDMAYQLGSQDNISVVAIEFAKGGGDSSASLSTMLSSSSNGGRLSIKKEKKARIQKSSK